MEIEGGRSRADREKLVSLHPSPDDFLIARQLDPEILARFHDEFGEPAKGAIRQWTLGYLTKLINTALSAKESVSGDEVSEANVNEAGYSLNRREDKGFKKLAGIFGGIFLGTGISTLVSIVQAGKFDRNGTILMAVAGILGAFLIAVDLPQDILPRWRKRTASTPSPPFKVRRRPINQAPKPPKA